MYTAVSIYNNIQPVELRVSSRLALRGENIIKITLYKNLSLKKLINALPQQYGGQLKVSDEVVIAVYYPKKHYVVTSTQANKGIEKLGQSDKKKIAIAYNFSEEAKALLIYNSFELVQWSNFSWTDESWRNSQF